MFETVLPWGMVGLFAIITGATLYSQYLRATGDTVRGDELYTRVEWVAHLVQAAEQTLCKQPGTARFRWVFDELRKRFPDTSEDDARILIESAVHQVNRAGRL